MGVIAKMSDSIKNGLRSFLEIQPPVITSFHLMGELDHAGSCIKNRLWYRGQAEELEQFWKQVYGESVRHRFWAAVPNVGREIEKIHVGLPALMVNTLTDIVITDLQQISITEPQLADIWSMVDDGACFYETVARAIREALIVGDGVFRITVDHRLSDAPVIEFVAGDRCSYEYERGRLKSCKISTGSDDGGSIHERYGEGFAEQWSEDRTGRRIADTYERIEWDGSYSLAIPLKFWESALYEGRGASIFDSKGETFDALDECWSQWMDSLRKARAKVYIPDALLPRDPKTGAPIAPNAFDNSYYATEGMLADGAAQRIEVVQADIRHEGYAQTYITALDIALMGIISPSTLGIDVKKLDNAEAQREKEKATLYTRNTIVATLQKVLPRVVRSAVMAWQTDRRQAVAEPTVHVEFGEYASPSFESVVETVGRAKVQGIMSVDAIVEELYGDTRSDEWKAEEVARLKAEQGLVAPEQPSVGWGY